ncbi:PAS domain-containing protein [Halobacterium salinarum]|uniref:ATP-binding protein n=1 Tax=Halobacterium salinarum TaxID=2242 RepID=UPI002556014A|nr:ATP-binding protein [Halobacterium salinarum]MDL0129805.1 PAS domain-containing protein [Halobacterium salinarum]
MNSDRAHTTTSDPQPVSLVCDRDGTIRNWNAAVAAAAPGDHPTDGTHLADVLSIDDPQSLIEAAQTHGTATAEGGFAHAPTTQYDFHASRLVDGRITIHGTATTPPDIRQASWVDRVTDAFVAVDNDARITYVNAEAESLLSAAESATPDTLLGCPLWEVLPASVGPRFRDAYRTAVDSQDAVSFTGHYDPADAVIEARLFPSSSGVSVYLQDVTERHAHLETIEKRERVLRRLYEETAETNRQPAARADTMLAIGCDFLGVAYGTLSEVSDDTYEFKHVRAPPHADVSEGTVVPLSETCCERVVTTEQTVVFSDVEDATTPPEFVVPGPPEGVSVGSYIGAPLFADGDLYGTLCFYDPEPQPEPFSDWAVTIVDLMAQWLTAELTDRHIRTQLEERNERLEDFASIVSHDIRNPLNVASGSLELAADSGAPEHFDRCRRAIERMNALVDDLLVLARTGCSAAEREPVDLAAVADDAWSTVDTDAAALTVTATTRVSADRSRLQELLANLFRNAVEHGSRPAADEPVTVTVGDAPGGFYVADDGRGIPESDRDTVFDHGFTTSADGTGFGLSIVRDVADAHDWTVSVTTSDDGGARLTITGTDAPTHE